ncbi:hypothetical protein SAMN05216327_102371 [Dyadobacter sp. SG02]|uniref:hypothetical protein n=1 Tax=Dyadobacter sp. SG02 TaxID=1855291 RepID=UPI0008B9A1FD|nr:hypothetical protein [Dyadobacter sp. SG02]SEI54558.1 hypothetical protein SAMN05216327_102371 [Dyadobacter sp. SG02]
MLNKLRTKALKSLKLLFPVFACIVSIFQLACDTDRNVPANPQSIIAGSDSSPVISKVIPRQKAVKNALHHTDTLAIKP